MKSLFILSAVLVLSSQAYTQGKQALLVIDVQNFYFPGGRSELVEPAAAAVKSAVAIEYMRSHNNPVIFIQHKSSAGMEINELVKPVEGEKIFVKEEVNSFYGTGLNDFLKELGVDTLIICGMQTHMCVEAAVRAAHDLGYYVLLLHDACATKNLKFEGREVSSADVHASTLATLKSYAEVLSTEEWIRKE